MSESKVQPNQQQNTPSDDDLERAIANDAARQLSGEEVVEEKPLVEDDTDDDKKDDEDKPEKHKDDEETHKRIARLAGEARIAKRENKALQEEIARLRGEKPPLPQDEEMERQIQIRAKQVADMKAYNDGCDKIFYDGVAQYPDFQNVVNTISKELGVMPVAFIEAAMEIGEPHKIIHYLGHNLDEAERIINLPPHKMGAALAKVAASKNSFKQQSKAPAPIKPIAGSSKNSSNDPEKMSMADFVKWQDRVDKERRGNR